MSPSWNFPKALPLRERLQNARFVPILIASIPYMHALVWYSMCVCRAGVRYSGSQAGGHAGGKPGRYACMYGWLCACLYAWTEGGRDGWMDMDGCSLGIIYLASP